MLKSLRNVASKAHAAASEIDLTHARTRITDTVDSLKDKVSSRIVDPADAYDMALEEVVSASFLPEFACKGLSVLVEHAREKNPYR